MKHLPGILAISLAVLGCSTDTVTNHPDSTANARSGRETPLRVAREVEVPVVSSHQDPNAEENHAEVVEAPAPELQLFRKLVDGMGSGYSAVKSAVGVPDATFGGTNLYGNRTYWIWLPQAATRVKEDIARSSSSISLHRDNELFVMAEFTSKQAMSSAGVTWPLFDGNTAVDGPSGSSLPLVRQNYPNLESALRVLGLIPDFKLVVLEREFFSMAAAKQRPTSLWTPLHRSYTAPDRVLVVISHGGSDYHLRCFVKSGQLTEKERSLNE